MVVLFSLVDFSAGLVTLVPLLFRENIEKTAHTRYTKKLLGMEALLVLLLLLIKPHTYHFGIAWWHAILGAGMIGESLQVLIPIVRRLIAREEIEFRFT
jgi:hypothetical protein